LFNKPNVVGVALGNKYVGGQDTGEKAITVLVEAKLPLDMLHERELVPSSLGNATVDVQEVGVLQAGTLPALTRDDGVLSTPTLDELRPSVPEDSAPPREQVGPLTLAKRFRPAFGGVSVGHFRITAGTLGTCCYDAGFFPGKPPRYYILSNNHVLANSNSATIGDPILQPGPIDGGTVPADVIARLSRFVPIKFAQPGQPAPLNFVDAAIAEGQFHELDRRIYWVGHLKGVDTRPRPLQLVQKCGRTTNYTTGRILNVNATVNVNYGGGEIARFARQIVTTDMSAGGDSGSVIANLDERAVGLLFAGSAVVTIANPISLVQRLLGIRISEG
jgi:hypothetical protein